MSQLTGFRFCIMAATLVASILAGCGTSHTSTSAPVTTLPTEANVEAA